MNSNFESSSSIGVAVVGAGFWGKNLIRNFSELGTLKAISDNVDGVAERFAEQHGVAPMSFSEILARNDIEGVAIATPAELHYEHAKLFLEGGKHVYVEKPLALDVRDGERLCRIAEECGRILMVGHLLQYHPAFIKLRDMVQSGQLGRLQNIASTRLNFGKIRREEDILWSFAPHDISMILSLVGEMPVRVDAIGAHHLHHNIADVTTTSMAFPGGETAQIYVSWLHPYKEQRLSVIGERGMVVFDDGEPWDRKLTLYGHEVDWSGGKPTAKRGDGVPVELDQSEPLKMECLHFLECIKNGDKPRTDGVEGLRVLSVLNDAAKSLDLHRMENTMLYAERERYMERNANIHASAVIDEDVVIGEKTRIWHFAHVLSGSRIGKGCVLGQNVMVGPSVSVGDGCKIQNNVSVYKGVTLEDDVFVGPSAVFTNVLNPRANVERKDEFRETVVKKGATIGANATIVCGCEIGAYAFVGAGAVVTKNVPPHALVVGAPARQTGWVSHAGEKLGDDLICPRTGRTYKIGPNGDLTASQESETN